MQKGNNRLYVVAAILGGLFLLGDGLKLPDEPQPTPNVPLCGPDLLPVFASHPNADEASHDLALFARLCDSIAGYLERDGLRQQPRLTKAVQFDDFRWRAREEVFDRNALTAKYGTFRAAIKTYLDSQLPDAGGDAVDKPGPDNKTLRQRWVETYRCLASSAQRAKERL